MTEHTPTPWQVDMACCNEHDTEVVAIYHRPSPASTIEVMEPGCKCGDEAISEEDAHHIVRCVNYHNLLKETLRRLCAACENLEYEAGRVDLPLQDAENLLNLLEQLEQTHD